MDGERAREVWRCDGVPDGELRRALPSDLELFRETGCGLIYLGGGLRVVYISETFQMFLCWVQKEKSGRVSAGGSVDLSILGFLRIARFWEVRVWKAWKGIGMGYDRGGEGGHVIVSVSGMGTDLKRFTCWN